MITINTSARGIAEKNDGGKYLGWPGTSYRPECHCLTSNYTSEDINEIIPFSHSVQSKVRFFGQI